MAVQSKAKKSKMKRNGVQSEYDTSHSRGSDWASKAATMAVRKVDGFA